MKAEPQKEHLWLQRLVGEWEMTGDGCGGGGDAVMGTERVRSLEGVWVVGEGSMRMPDGSPASSLLTLGFDPARGRFVGTWIGSMMSHLWVYDGVLDEAGTTLTLDTEGPRFSPDGKAGGMARYQDVISIDSAGDRLLTSRMLGEDGVWHDFMSARYRRIG